jgi:hypothetical protein
VNLHWGALGKVVVIGTGASVAVVAVFACGVVAMDRSTSVRVPGRSGRAPRVAAGLCFAACVAAVLYGIYLIIPQFH